MVCFGGFCCLVLDMGGGDGVVDGTAFPTHCLGGFYGRGGLVGEEMMGVVGLVAMDAELRDMEVELLTL